MRTSQRFFQDGVTDYDGYKVDVIRFTSAVQNGASSRIAAKHWGTITTPSGEVHTMGESGMTTTDIKKFIAKISRGAVAYTAQDYGRGGASGESAELRKMRNLRKMMADSGLPTADIDAKISAKEAEIETSKASKVNAKRIKELEKEIAKLSKLHDDLVALNVPTTDIDIRLANLVIELNDLKSPETGTEQEED